LIASSKIELYLLFPCGFSVQLRFPFKALTKKRYSPFELFLCSLVSQDQIHQLLQLHNNIAASVTVRAMVLLYLEF
jgi:hypothetical protein